MNPNCVWEAFQLPNYFTHDCVSLCRLKFGDVRFYTAFQGLRGVTPRKMEVDRHNIKRDHILFAFSRSLYVLDTFSWKVTLISGGNGSPGNTMSLQIFLQVYFEKSCLLCFNWSWCFVEKIGLLTTIRKCSGIQWCFLLLFHMLSSLLSNHNQQQTTHKPNTCSLLKYLWVRVQVQSIFLFECLIWE